MAINPKTLVIAWHLYCNTNASNPGREDFMQDLEPRHQVLLIKSAYFHILRKHFCPTCWEKTAKRVDADGRIEMHCPCGGKYVVDVETKTAVVA